MIFLSGQEKNVLYFEADIYRITYRRVDITLGCSVM